MSARISLFYSSLNWCGNIPRAATTQRVLRLVFVSQSVRFLRRLRRRSGLRTFVFVSQRVRFLGIAGGDGVLHTAVAAVCFTLHRPGSTFNTLIHSANSTT